MHRAILKVAFLFLTLTRVWMLKFGKVVQKAHLEVTHFFQNAPNITFATYNDRADTIRHGIQMRTITVFDNEKITAILELKDVRTACKCNKNILNEQNGSRYGRIHNLARE